MKIIVFTVALQNFVLFFFQMSMSAMFLHISPLYVSMLSAVTQMEALSVSAILASYLMAEIINIV